LSMFDFCFVIASQSPRLTPNKLHEKYLANISYASKQVSGRHFSCEYYCHTDLSNEGFIRDGELYCSLLGKAYTNNKYAIDHKQALRQLNAGDLIGLYQKHGKDFIQYVKGIFLVVICDEAAQTYLAYTSKSGLYRLYYSHDNDTLFISSSLSSIINNMSSAPQLDDIALIQHGVFEHTLGERTFYQGIKMLDNHCYLDYDLKKVKLHEYYNLAMYLKARPEYSWKETTNLLPDEFNKAMDAVVLGVDKFNSALTGGYDSRTILSYILNRKIEGYCLYTWAADKQWEDVAVASLIAEKLKLKYDSIELGVEMIKHYEENSDKQIYWTDGSGSINRCNQMYSHEVLVKYSRDLISGYFGSELFRPLHRSNVMIREHFVDLLFSTDRQQDFSTLISSIRLSGFNKPYFQKHRDEFVDSSLEYFKSLEISEHKHVNYYHYIIKTGFWKFFGQEFHSQRINTRMSSPYLDDDFVQFLVQTPIVNIHKDTYKKHGYYALKGQALYHPIIKRNCPELMKLRTNRGFAPQDFDSFIYPLNVLFKHYFSKRRQKKRGVVGFNSKEWNITIFDKRVNLLAMKDGVFEPINPNDPRSGFWYSLKWYLALLS